MAAVSTRTRFLDSGVNAISTTPVAWLAMVSMGT